MSIEQYCCRFSKQAPPKGWGNERISLMCIEIKL